MPTLAKRLPRFRRNREAIRPFKLMARDLEILRQVARHRFLSSPQIWVLVGGAPPQILRRLQCLYHAGYLDRPRCQIDFFHEGGSRPMAYCLASKGAALMRREEDMPFNRMVWSKSGRPVGRIFLEHALMISEILVGVINSCEGSARRVRYCSAEELAPLPNRTTNEAGAFRWSIQLGGRRIGLVPDAVFILEYESGGPEPERVVCFLEADRGTMPIRRRNPALSSFSRKLDAYAALWKRGDIEKRFGTKRVAVHAVTTSEERSENLRKAIKSLPQGQGLFAVHSFLDPAAVVQAMVSHSVPSDKRRNI